MIDYRSTKRGELSVAALPGTHVRVQWLHENGAIEYERVYQRHEASASQPERSQADVEIILDYLSRQWLPVPVLEASRRLRAHVESVDVALLQLQQENERLLARLKPDAAYF